MKLLSRTPADAYRRVDLDARIEASSGEALTVICLEEAMAALAHALLAFERTPEHPPTVPLTRAHGILISLARGVSEDNPLQEAMELFYTGLSATIARNINRCEPSELEQARRDIADLLGVVKAG